MVPFQNLVKIPQQKWYHFRQKRVKIPQQNVTFQKRIKNPQQKWYHFRKGSKILNKNGTISENGKNSSTKMVPFQAEKGKNSSTKNVPFQKRVKIPQQKWYHFRKVQKFIDKDDTISEKGQNSSTKMVPFLKRIKIPQ